MLKKMMVFALMASATACATTYRVPQQEAPPEWREDGKPIGFAPVEGSARSFPGNLKEHGVIMEFDVENERTAIITNTLEWTGPFGGTNIIPAGSPAYARQFSLQQSSNYGSYFGKNLNAYNNPVEWCVPRFDKGDAVCIFWEGPDRARYIDTSGGTPQNASPMSPSGMVGPMPQIQEQAVDFGHPMKVQLVVDTFRSNRITVAARISEGNDWATLGRGSKIVFEEDDTVILKRFEGEFKLTAHHASNGAITDVDVEVIKEPKAVRMQTLKDVLEMFMALQAAEAAAKAEAAEDTGETGTEAAPVEE